MKSFKVTSIDDTTITKVNGVHEAGKSHMDVTYFRSDYKKFTFIPKGIEKFFKNLDNVLFASSDIKMIRKSDLIPFGNKLTRFWFSTNKIEVIESDLFEGNPNLDHIQLYSNNIKHVEIGAFNHLTKLSTLSFSSNPCSSGTSSDRSSVIKLIAEIENKCQNQQVYQNHLELYPKIITEKIKSELEILNEKLTEEIVELKKNHEALKQRLQTEGEKCSLDMDQLKQDALKSWNFINIQNQTLLNCEQDKIKLKADVEKEKKICDASVDRNQIRHLEDTLIKKLIEMEAKMETKHESILENLFTFNSTCLNFDYKLKNIPECSEPIRQP